MKGAAVWQPLCVAVHINNWSGGLILTTNTSVLENLPPGVPLQAIFPNFKSAPPFELPPQTLLLQLTRPRHPYGTQKVLLSAAPFLT